MSDFITPPNHINFRAKKLFSSLVPAGHDAKEYKCQILDGAIAYIDLKGGGPTEQHTHAHSHLFIVTQGEAKILLGDREIIIKKDESFLVDGTIPHSVWNNIAGETVVIGITVV